MAQFPLTVAAMRLGGISLYTLRQRCEKADIDLEQQRSLADPRAKWLSEEQLLLLAAAHGRVLDQPPTEPELIPPAAYKLMMEQVAQALQQYELFSNSQADLESGLAQLVEQGQAITRQLAALREADHELVQRHQRDYAELVGQQETTHAALEGIELAQEEEKQAVADRFEEVMRAAQLQEARIGESAITARQQAERLTTFSTQLASLLQTQQEMQDQARQAEQRLQASFQDALAVLHQEMQEELDRKAATLLGQIQEPVEAATAAAQAAQGRAVRAEQRVDELATLLQTEQESRQKLEKRVTRLGADGGRLPKQPSTPRKARQKKADS